MIMYNSRACAKAVHQTGLLKGENCFRMKFFFFSIDTESFLIKIFSLTLHEEKEKLPFFCLLS